MVFQGIIAKKDGDWELQLLGTLKYVKLYRDKDEGLDSRYGNTLMHVRVQFFYMYTVHIGNHENDNDEMSHCIWIVPVVFYPVCLINKSL